ncbi:hypothetical protein HYX16_05385 [Candidatus Woesearchaeota archaeon]|nr:hypothetical protein [Candidatus Woesearchaeota archaeon]
MGKEVYQFNGWYKNSFIYDMNGMFDVVLGAPDSQRHYSSMNDFGITIEKRSRVDTIDFSFRLNRGRFGNNSPCNYSVPLITYTILNEKKF